MLPLRSWRLTLPRKPGFYVLCPMHWTVRVASLQGSLTTMRFFSMCGKKNWMPPLDGVMCAHNISVETQMMKLDFLLGVCLGSLFFFFFFATMTIWAKLLSTRPFLQPMVNMLPSSLCSAENELISAVCCFLPTGLPGASSLWCCEEVEKWRAPQRSEVGSSTGTYMSCHKLTTGKYTMENWIMLLKPSKNDLTSLDMEHFRISRSLW